MHENEYLKLAAVEDRMWYFRALRGHVRRALAPRFPGRAAMLDAGCGTGGLIRAFSVEHPEWTWTGVDASPVAVDITRKRCGAAAAIAGGIVESLPVGDAAFDAVVSTDVLYSVADDGAALREFFRVLRPGGVAVIVVPAYPWLWSYHDEAVHAVRRYGRGELLQKLGSAGFARATATHTNMLPFPLIVARRKLLPAPASGSDVRLFPAPLEALFNAMMATEAWWLGLGCRLPFGSSILAIAEKPRTN